MASITSKAGPLPKLRVTCLSCTAQLPQWTQRCSAEIGGDVAELAGEADFDGRFGRRTIERDACDDALDCTGLGVTMALGDLPREDDVSRSRMARSSSSDSSAAWVKTASFSARI
jgi:hypothetical protein